MADLCELADVKKYLIMTSNNDDDLLSRLITSATSFIESYCCRKFSSQEYTETFSGRELPFHMCKASPVTAVAGLSSDGRGNIKVRALDGYRVIVDTAFPRGFYNCSITYTAGYEAIPDDLKQACIELVSIKYKTREHIDVSSKSLQGETTTYIVKDVPDYIKVILNTYKRHH